MRTVSRLSQKFAGFSSAWLGAAGLAALLLAPGAVRAVDLLGRWPNGPCHVAEQVGERLYMGRGAELIVLDLSAQTTTVLGTLLLPSFISGMAVRDGVAYVVNDLRGLRVVDVSDPSAMVEIAAFETTTPARDIELDGDIAYFVDGLGLHTFDVSDPSNPVHLAFVGTASVSFGVDVWNGHAFVADNFDGMRIFDVSDPADPIEVGAYVPPICIVEKVMVVDGLAYVADWLGLHIVDVSNPAAPAEVGFLDSLGYPFWDVTVSGDYAYLAVYSQEGLWVVDVSDPANPTVSTRVPGSGMEGAFRVSTDGQTLLLADGSEGMRIFSLLFPENPAQIDDLRGGGFSYCADAQGELLFVGQGLEGLRVLDVSSPDAPVEIGSFDTDWSVYGVTIEGDLAYLSDGLEGLRIVDISDPSAPFEIGSLVLPDWVYEVVIDGPKAYLANGSDGLAIVDVSDPTAPVLLGSVDPGNSNSTTGVDVRGSVAYTADGSEGVRAWDVSDPTEPFVVSHAAFATGARHLELDGQHLYVADTGVGLRIFDVSQPTVLTHAGTVGTPHVATDVTVSEGFAYVADDWSGVRVIDVSDPESATEVDFYDTGHWARGVAEANGLVFVADGYDGIYVIDNRPPASIPASPRSSARLLPARPNPFQNSTQIGFSLALGGRAVVEVFDPTGRRIRTLYDGELPAGKYEVIWDGVDDAGVPAPSGIYYHRIESTEGAAVGRLVLMR